MAGVTVLEVSDLMTTAVFPNNLNRSTQTISICLWVPLEKISGIYGYTYTEGQKRKSCRIVIEAANYYTLFGFFNIRETRERLVLFQRIARNTLADIHITPASYVLRMLNFAVFSFQCLCLWRVYLWEKEKEQLGTSQVSSAVTSDTRSIVSCVVLASENSTQQINEMEHFLLLKNRYSLRKYSLIYVVPP
jgi:hypothetical protein